MYNRQKQNVVDGIRWPRTKKVNNEKSEKRWQDHTNHEPYQYRDTYTEKIHCWHYFFFNNNQERKAGSNKEENGHWMRSWMKRKTCFERYKAHKIGCFCLVSFISIIFEYVYVYWNCEYEVRTQTKKRRLWPSMLLRLRIQRCRIETPRKYTRKHIKTKNEYFMLERARKKWRRETLNVQ